ncbi:type II secretion system minor pseudopilin GspK [Desulfopila aestuarii]|uniref:General secretion pathway protein K n=1 Tax=Desulfopila aestuarii DSM 18488 TaxID=1121416 RepID=A0A1M7YE26_9BACT|nr:type II secretion system minor pseudopilin GspK [Desulfopila aestuarii]SHO50892.1 general secretion pathway protein K [Desulfopila aestuarii DSM 18488]
MLLAHMRSIGREQQGMALLITIMVVSLLIGVTVQFSKSVRHSYFSSAAQLEGQRLSAIARSGLAIGTALLEVDGKANNYDTLFDEWALVAPDKFTDLFPRGEVHLTVEDLSGRLQINSLVMASGGDGSDAPGTPDPSGVPDEQTGTDGSEQPENNEMMVNKNRELLNQLLASGILMVDSPEEAREISDALIDWLDPDDEESEFGAESGYYRSLNPAYESRNGPVTEISELLLVKGITPRLLYGEGDSPGLADFITVHGTDGKLNINTTPLRMLQALNPLMTEELAGMLDEFRRAEGNRELLVDSGWYRNVPGFPGDIELPAAVLSVASATFLLKSEGRLDEQTRSITAVVERKADGTVSIVEQRVE